MTIEQKTMPIPDNFAIRSPPLKTAYPYPVRMGAQQTRKIEKDKSSKALTLLLDMATAAFQSILDINELYAFESLDASPN